MADKKSTQTREQHAGATQPPSRTDELLTDFDIHLFNEGTHYHLWEKLGAHARKEDGRQGYRFGVWAPNASSVSMIGDFNGWNPQSHPLKPRGSSGIWEGFIPDVKKGSLYKFHIVSKARDYQVDKPDPYGIFFEQALRGASIAWDLDYQWNDQEWMVNRGERNSGKSPISIYEMHIGSWMRVPEEGNRPLSYRELADRLTAYLLRMGFTHVELMPVMEHPFYGSWGYQVTGLFGPTSRYGSPQDFMYLIDRLHDAGIGVILDWVPSHFAKDEHGLGIFDGTHLYEHASPLQGVHPDWDTYVFNYGRNEVVSYLISNALYWLGVYHIDGLRVDAVASMLYLDYSRKEGEWVPNKFGGRENIEAIEFLRRFNSQVYQEYPDVQTYAEESTAWPMVSRPTYVGGLGFGSKWDMGWMHDTLAYFQNDPVYRKFHQDQLTFRQVYAFTESFTMPLSHDEVVHGKRSLLEKMPGDDWQKFANLRTMYGYMFAQPGKKLLFMGAELGQRREWNHDSSLDWHLTQQEPNSGLQTWLAHLNDLYRRQPAMHELDWDQAGFEWCDCSDSFNSIISFFRKASGEAEMILVVFNLTPVPRYNYRLGVPYEGYWAEILNSDAHEYGGSGHGNMGGVQSAPIAAHGHMQSLNLTLPPLSAIFLKHVPAK